MRIVPGEPDSRPPYSGRWRGHEVLWFKRLVLGDIDCRNKLFTILNTETSYGGYLQVCSRLHELQGPKNLGTILAIRCTGSQHSIGEGFSGVEYRKHNNEATNVTHNTSG
ncbi:hypothetical protein WG66_008859 [Moniliophthora roreri]|nr:hypothetical protein WG66_008859 [Moniliophthora roreri]